MEIFEIAISSGITFLALVLVTVSLLSYWKYRKIKLLLITGVFLLFLIRGILLSITIFYPQYSTILTTNYIWSIDLLVLIILYIASLKR